MPPAVSRADMQWLDRRAIDHYGIPELCLMENAGAGCAREVTAMLGDAPGRRVDVLCGRGNNGGDGFVIARRLADTGMDVRVFVAGGVAAVRPGGAAFTNLEVVKRLGLPLVDLLPGDAVGLGALGVGADLVIDALFGTGLDRPVTGLDRAVIDAVNASGRPVLAIDIPSGLDADTGEPLGGAVRAQRTATLGIAKLGFARGHGPEYAGEVVVVDIGIPRRALLDLFKLWLERDHRNPGHGEGPR